MMKRRFFGKALSVLLITSMVFTTVDTSVFAAGNGNDLPLESMEEEIIADHEETGLEDESTYEENCEIVEVDESVGFASEEMSEDETIELDEASANESENTSEEIIAGDNSSTDIVEEESEEIMALEEEKIIFADDDIAHGTETTICADDTEGSMTWSINAEGVLTVDGSGNVHVPGESYIYHGTVIWPWEEYKEQITKAYVKLDNFKYAKKMFAKCKNVISIEFIDCDTSNVASMMEMFNGCEKLYSLDLHSFDTRNVTDMSWQFYNCSGLTSLDISNFNTSNVTDMSWQFYKCSSLTSLVINNFDTSKVTNMRYMFFGCSQLTSLDISNFDTNKVTDMRAMFRGCENLTNLDVSGFATSNVTDMGEMFCSCRKLTSIDASGFDTRNVTDMHDMFLVCENLTNLDVSGFDTSKVTDMGRMFCSCESLTSLDVSKFNTGNVTDMHEMFEDCSNLTSLDVSKFNTGNVTDMREMFSNCNKLTNLDVGGFNVSSTDISDMFEDCISLISLDLSNFHIKEDQSNVFLRCNALKEIKVPANLEAKIYFDSMDYMNAWRLNEEGEDLEYLPLNQPEIVTIYKYTKLPNGKALSKDENGEYSWYIWNITDDGVLNIEGSGDLLHLDNGWGYYQEQIVEIRVKVDNCTQPQDIWWNWNSDSLKKIDLSESDLSNMTDTFGMFTYAESVENIDLSGLDLSNITWMAGLFSDLSNLKTVDLSGTDATNVESMGNMFKGCSSLESVNFNDFKVANLLETENMFEGCSSLKTLDLSGIDTSNVTDMSSMFYNCENLGELILDDFNTSSVTTMRDMFYGCTSLSEIDLSSFDTENVTDMSNMFCICSGIKDLNLSSFNTANVTDMESMFYGCSTLESLNLSSFDTSNVASMRSMFRDCTSLVSLDLSNFDASKYSLQYEFESYIGMIDRCESLVEIKAPLNLSIIIELPKHDWPIGSYEYWYINGDIFDDTEYLPLDLQDTVTLNRGIGGSEITTCADGTDGKVNWNITDGKLSINGSGDVEIDNLGEPSWPWRYVISEPELEITSAEVRLNNFTNANAMLRNAKTLERIDLSGSDTSDVTTMRDMFAGCTNLRTLNIYGLDTSNVTDTVFMLSDCKNLESVDLSSINLKKVEKTGQMLSGCDSLSIIKAPLYLNQYVSLPIYEENEEWYIESTDWNAVTDLPMNLTKTVTLVKEMKGTPRITINKKSLSKYVGEEYLLAATLLNIPEGESEEVDWISSDENVASVDANGKIIAIAEGKVTIMAVSKYNKELSASCEVIVLEEKSGVVASGSLGDNILWDIDAEGVLHIEGTGDISYDRSEVEWKWNDSNINDTLIGPWYEYKDDIVKVEVDLSDFTNAYCLFANLCNVKEIDVSNMDTSNVTDMRYMFANCPELEAINNLSGLNTSKVTDMEGLFAKCTGLTRIDVSQFDTSNVECMDYMFAYCSKLTSISLKSFDTSNVWSMGEMFNDCRSLTNLDLSSFNTSKVQSLYRMFCDCKNLESVDISSFDISNVGFMPEMFSGCSSLKWLDISNFNTKNVYEIQFMLAGCSSLSEIVVPVMFEKSVSLPSSEDYYWYIEGDKKTAITKIPTDLTEVKSIYKVSMSNIDVTEITILYNKTTVTTDGINIKVGDEITLTAQVLPEDATDKSVSWSTEDTDIITISGEGKVTAIALGTATVTVTTTDGEKKASCKIVVAESSASPEVTPSASPEVTPSASPETTPSASPEVTPSASPEVTPSASPETTPSASPEVTPSVSPETTPSESPEISPVPTVAPTKAPADIIVAISENDIEKKDSDELNEIVATAIEKAVTVSVAEGMIYSGDKNIIDINLKVGNVVLAEGTDYTVSYKNNVNAGNTAQVTIKFTGDYKKFGTVTKTYNILSKNMETSKIVVADLSFTEKQKGKVAAKPVVYYGGKKLTLNKDYSLMIQSENGSYVSYNGKDKISNNCNLKIVGIGNYKGERIIKVSFLATDDTRIMLSKATVKGVKAQSYTGKNIILDMSQITVKAGGETLIYGEDYTVSYENNIEVGTATMVLSATSNSTKFVGSKLVTFKITGEKISKAVAKLTVNDKEVATKKGMEATFTGSAIEPKVTLTLTDGTVLTEGKDYTVTFKKNRKKGTAQVVITGKAGFTGTKTVKFKIKQ